MENKNITIHRFLNYTRLFLLRKSKHRVIPIIKTRNLSTAFDKKSNKIAHIIASAIRRFLQEIKQILCKRPELIEQKLFV